MEKSAVILAVDQTGFKEDKGMLQLEGKPLLDYVIEAVEGFVDEIVVVACSQGQADSYAQTLPSNARVIVEASGKTLDAASAGFQAVEGDYTLLVPFDAPFISPDVVSLLFDLSGGKAAVIPRTPDCEMEPLQAVYATAQALSATKEVLAGGEDSLDAMVSKLKGVRYVSTMVIEQLDPELKTFFTVNTLLDLKKAAVMLQPKKHKKTAAKR